MAQLAPPPPDDLIGALLFAHAWHGSPRREDHPDQGVTITCPCRAVMTYRSDSPTVERGAQEA